MSDTQWIDRICGPVRPDRDLTAQRAAFTNWMTQLQQDPERFYRAVQYARGQQWIPIRPMYPTCIQLPEGI